MLWDMHPDDKDAEIELTAESRTSEDASESYPAGSGKGLPSTLKVDLDGETGPDGVYRHHVWLMFFAEGEPWFRLTVDEAARLRDRLTLILGPAPSKGADDVAQTVPHGL